MIAAIFAAALAIHPLSHPFSIRTTEQGGGFSVDLPVVGRVHGATTTFFTALDVTNNTTQPTDVDFMFTPADGSTPRAGVLASLAGFDNAHFDDFLQALSSAGVITPNQAQNTFGTLLLTFTNPSFHTGSEATAVARIYSIAPQGGGTFGLSYRAQPMETDGAHALTTVIRNTTGSVSNIGFENLGIDDRRRSPIARRFKLHRCTSRRSLANQVPAKRL